MSSTTTKFAVHVSPGAKHNQLIGWREGMLWVKVAAPPVDNKANKALIDFLSTLLDVAPSSLQIISGAAARIKILSVSGRSKEEVRAKLKTELL